VKKEPAPKGGAAKKPAQKASKEDPKAKAKLAEAKKRAEKAAKMYSEAEAKEVFKAYML
jgi:hypothetical protein